MSHPERVFRDLMHRTWKNLLFVEKLLEDQVAVHGVQRVKKDGPYEVTQLINSFLGAFGLPRENEIPDKLTGFSIARAEAEWDFPALEDIYPDQTMFYRDGRELPKSEMNLNDLCKFIRNSILHGNFEFGGHIDADGDTEISTITFWNERSNRERTRSWGTRTSIVELRQILSSFYSISSYIFDEFEGQDPDPEGAIGMDPTGT